MALRHLLTFILRIAAGIASQWRNLLYRAMGVRMQGYSWLRKIEIAGQYHSIELNRCSLDRGVVLLCGGPESTDIKLSIGGGTYVNRHTFFDAVERISVGEHVAIGPGCYITDHDHGTDLSHPPLRQPTIAKPTRIDDWAWLGANVIVLKGVSIGARAIIGAGSVVTRDIPADVIAVGSPARVLRKREPGSGSGAGDLAGNISI